MQKSYAVTENLEYQVQDGKVLTELSVSDTLSSMSVRGVVGGSDIIHEVKYGKNVKWVGDGCFANNEA